MSVPRTRTLSLLLLAVLALSTLAGAPVSAFRSREIRGVLFTAPPQPAARARAADPTVIRSRLVTIDIGALQAARPMEPNATVRASLLLNLFDDLAYNAVVDRVDPADGGFTWVGHIPGFDLSTVTLASIDGIVAGSIVMPEAVYAIRYIGGGIHEVAQIDQSKFPSELDPVVAPPVGAGRAPGLAPDEPVIMGDDGSTIDVLVLYTPAATAAAGGATAMTTRVNLGISETNTSYANSGITQRLRLVNTQQVTYAENSDLAQDLYAVGNYNGSVISTAIGNTAASLRDAYGADLVMLITSPSNPNGCGISWLVTSLSTSFARYGFSVVEQSCVSPNYTFGHELGHNMGARHDWYMDAGKTPFTYAHGYVDPPNRFRTLMSYNTVCSVQGFNCTRLLYWANPGVYSSGFYGSAAMGIAGGTKSDCPTGNTSNISCDADDHLTLNNTALTVANFRQTASPAAPSITTHPSSQTVTAGATATFAAAASGNPSPAVRWQVSTNGGGSWSDISGATSTSYAFTVGSGDSGRQYRAVFTSILGSATTNPATLTVRTPPSITMPPSDATATAGGSVSFSAAASSSPAPTVQWQVSTDGGSVLTNIPGATATTYTFVAATADHNNRYRAVFTSAGGSTPTSAATLTISGQITVDPSPLRFAATKTGAGSAIAFVTPAQTVSVSGITRAWTATAGQTWLQVTGGAGTGAGQFSVSIVNPGDVIGASTSLSGSITVTTSTAPASSASIPVTLTVYRPGTTGSPYGGFDTPVDGTTGMQGSFAVTGWALDDVGIDRVEIWRDPVAGETTPVYAGPGPGTGKIFIARPLFIFGSRPDVEAAYATAPAACRSGWGYLLLSWGLANQGNGPYRLYAFAFDQEGHSTTLGTKMIQVDNPHAIEPFGALDTPAFGASVSGGFWNYGWALTPNASPTCTIANGGVLVGIDSGPLVPVIYGDPRSDIASSFVGFSNGSNSGGAYYIDTTTLSNGMHQIGWLVTDNCGRQDGIGSRFFTVLNSGARPAGDAGAVEGSAPPGAAASVSANPGGFARKAEGSTSVMSNSAPIGVRHLAGEWETVPPNAEGRHVIEVPQDGRIEVRLPQAPSGTFKGYQMMNDQRRPLPLGSSLDAGLGLFYWQPAAGFLGGFNLVFVTPDEATVAVRVVVGPPVRLAIDLPAADDVVSGLFTVAGWAVDLASEGESGIDTVHVWAYPLDGSTPIWLGVAEYGDSRPDVGALYGAAFANSSYSLSVGGLAPGSYDVVVYSHRARTGTFEGARIVRITVR